MKYSIKSRFSLAFLLVIFFNAFVDLGHKVLLQDTLQHTLLNNGALGEHSYIIFTSILNAFILLPFILLFTPSGFISDKFSKTKVMFWSSLAAVPIMILITWAYYKGQFWLAYFMTLLLGAQSAINTPAKYGHIKELYSKTNLAKANAYTQAIGIIAILASTCVFTILFSHYMQIGPGSGHLSQAQILQRFAPLGFILIILSCLETIMTLFLVKRRAAHPEATYEVKDYFKLNHLKRYWRLISGNKVILICTLALTAYWSVSQLIIVSYGAFLTQHVAGMSTLFVQGSIAVAGVGVLFGALYAGKVSRGYIETGIIPVAAVALTVCLYLMTHTFNRAGVIIIELCYGFFGGLFIVPLNALIQCEADERNLGKVMAGNSFCQNIGMFTFLVGNTVSALLNVSSGQMLNLAFLLFLALTVIAVYLLPQYLLRFIVSLVMRRFNDLNVIGLDNIPEKGGSC